MKSRRGSVVVGASALVAGLWFGCNSSGSSNLDVGSLGGGGAGGSYTPPRCGQTCQDYLVGLALDQTIWLLFNQNVAGTPSGNVDRNGACPLGGSAHITGTTSVASNGVTTLHLVMSLATCANTASLFSLTFAGSVAIDGTFQNSTTKYTAVTISTDSLVASGSLKFLDDPPIDETCNVAEVQQSSDGADDSLDGRVCGREFSSATALKNLSGGGSGTGGAGGGSAGAGVAGSGFAGFAGMGGSGLDGSVDATTSAPSDAGDGGSTVCCCAFGLDQYWHCVHAQTSDPSALCYVPWPECCDQQYTLCN